MMVSRPSPVKPGKNLTHLSSRESWPVSTKVITAAAVMGLVMDASRNTGSVPLAVPKLRRNWRLPCVTRMEAPATRPSLIQAAITAAA